MSGNPNNSAFYYFFKGEYYAQLYLKRAEYAELVDCLLPGWGIIGFKGTAERTRIDEWPFGTENNFRYGTETDNLRINVL